MDFLHQDDFVDKSYFNVIRDALASRAELVSFGVFNYVHKENGEIEIFKSEMNIDISFDGDQSFGWAKFAVTSFFASPWNKVFLSSVIKDNGIRFKEGVVCFEDYMFCLEYSRHIKSVKCISTPIYYYRNYESINHVSKRKWGERFFISRLVHDETVRFIKAKGGEKVLENLHRYTYQAYTVELKAAKLLGENIESVVKKVLHEKGFAHAVKVITPRGKYFPVLSLLISFKLYGVAAKMIKKRI